MASERYLAIVGLNEEDTAHLRLLLRMVVGQLEQRWRWGTEENADLVIVDPTELAGQIARNRAFSSGRRCTVYSETEPLRDGELRLSRPPKAENLAAVLNGSVSNAVAMDTAVTQQKDDFYGIDNLTPEFELEDEEAATARSHQREDNPAPGLDELLKPDEAARKPQFAVPGQLDEDTLIEGTSGPSKRGERRVADSVEGFRKPGRPHEGVNMSPPVKRGAPTTDHGKHSLQDYLKGNLLGGPATFTLEGVAPLTLDPKEKMYHSTATLLALSRYCEEPLPASGWKRVTSAELTQLRTTQRAQPYSRLIWLAALVRSQGRLASHLDPGGRYKLKRWSDIEHENPDHMRIATAMKEPAKLNEIAAASGASMAEVFAVVSAYDAIGMIDVERRQPRHDTPTAAPGGLLSRLRKPFGKS